MSNPSRSRSTMVGACAIACVFMAFATHRARADETPPTGVAHAAEQPATPSGAVFVDPVGFLLFGPTLGVELSLGRQYSVVAYGRWLDAGVVARSLFESSTDKFAFSYGGGLKGRYYFNGGLMGPYMGVAVEALKTRTESQADKIATNNLIVVPEIEGGYHVAFGRFFAGAALAIGYVVQASKSVVDIDGGTQAKNFEAKDYSTIYGSAGVDLGFLF